MTSQQIRQQFIDFFVQRHGHTFVPSSPVVPHDDPTLLFTNAGMNQFKPIFLGTEKRPYTRAVNTQKCIRAGGKHNDLDDVGRSRRHHTFFEMLGNWSFGDYFKREAIAWSWELLTKVWGIDPTRLHVSVHAGDAATGVPRDDEAADLWREIAGIPADRIHYGGKDNFWEMGETGPCGPCTEIFIDRTPDKSGGPSVLSGEDPRVMEIWNNVFIQYNRNPDRSLTPLPAQHVDTGMGLERIIQILQNVDDNYAIDLFNPFWQALKDLSGFTYSGKYPKTNAADPEAEARDAQLRHDIAFRVIADHVRCLTFALTDGAVPSNEGRGYVLRRILRRAVRFGRQQLELKDPFLHTLVPVVVDAMSGAFPELKNRPENVAEIIKDEEVSFGRTLEAGILDLEFAVAEDAARTYARAHDYASTSARRTSRDAFSVTVDFFSTPNLISAASEQPQESHTASQLMELLRREGLPLPNISGALAFELHDTHGFPVDLTQVMAAEKGINIDLASFDVLLEEQRRRSRAGSRVDAALATDIPPGELAGLRDLGVKPTDDHFKFASTRLDAYVMAIWDGSKLIQRAEKDEKEVAILLDQTNFYAEMGGQVGDVGTLTDDVGRSFEVNRTKALGGYVLHVGRVSRGGLEVGTRVVATVNAARQRTEKNHTATHLANWALREVLGEGVQQKGSLVDPDKLRFDFSHAKALSEDELARIEELVAQCIERKLPVYAEEAPQEQALKINGLRAVFGEKYPPMVRVVSIGVPVADLLNDPANETWRQFSVEFCGGTHVKRADEIKSFAITAEESVSKGIRRIVALTGRAASAALSQSTELLNTVERARTLPESDLAQAIPALQKQLGAFENVPLRAKRRVQSAIAELQTRLKGWEKTQQKSSSASGVDAVDLAAQLLDRATALGPGKLVVGELPGADNGQLLAAMDSLRKKTPSIALMLASATDGKVNFVAAVSDDLIAQGLKAGDWIREVAKVAGGGGGGRPNMAQAGGKDPAKLPDALARAREFARGALK